MTPLVQYLKNKQMPTNKEEAKKIMRLETKCTMVLGKLYNIRKTTPMLRFLGEVEIILILMEIHAGVYGSCLIGMTLELKLLRSVYYLLSGMKDNIDHVNKCFKFQRNSNLHHALFEVLQLITLSSSFYQLGIDILGRFALTPR